MSWFERIMWSLLAVVIGFAVAAILIARNQNLSVKPPAYETVGEVEAGK